MKVIVYKTINDVNNFEYIGVHEEDGSDYFGNGCYHSKKSSYSNKIPTYFRSAVNKYGHEHFHRITLKEFDNYQDALDLERWLVDEEYIKREDTYNTTLGGGLPPNLRKPIYQYTLDGKYKAEWPSVKTIVDFYSVNKDRVRMVIKDRRSLMGYYWSDIKQDKIDITFYRPSARGIIFKYTPNGNLLCRFRNMTEAARADNLKSEDIQNYNKRHMLLNGFYYLREADDIKEFLKGCLTDKETRKPIYKYSLNGNYIAAFKNKMDVRKFDSTTNMTSLENAIKKHLKYKGFYWSYTKYNNIIKEDENIIQDDFKDKKIYQYTLEGKFVREWDSVTECTTNYPLAVQVCLGNKIHCKKFKFYFEKL